MPEKNTAKPQKNQTQRLTEDWKFIFKWVFVLGGVIAGLANMFGVQNEFLISGLMLAGVLVGIFYFDSEDLINIGLRYLIFVSVANSVGGFYKIGPYLNGFLVGFSFYLGPIVLTLVVVYFVKKYILNKS